MKKYGFQIIGDNTEGSPVLFDCTFTAKDGSDLEAFRTAVFNSFPNPQRVGAAMTATAIYEKQ